MSDSNREWGENTDEAIAARKAKEWLRQSYGDRCQDYEQTCVICQKWRQFEELFSDDVPDDLQREYSVKILPRTFWQWLRRKGPNFAVEVTVTRQETAPETP